VSVPHLIAIASWPLIALGFAMAIVAQHRGTQSTAIRFLMFCLVGAPIFLIFTYRYQSGLNLLVQDLTLIPGGFCACWGGIYLWRNAEKLVRTNPTVVYPKPSAVVGLFMGVGLAAYGAVSFRGDFIVERSEVAGVVTKKYVRHSRYGNYYYVEIEGRRFPTTADIYDQIQPLSRVHAMVGHGTGNIFTATN
jgi:hypothetical protein